jgi:hypothetical protein
MVGNVSPNVPMSYMAEAIYGIGGTEWIMASYRGELTVNGSDADTILALRQLDALHDSGRSSDCSYFRLVIVRP